MRLETMDPTPTWDPSAHVETVETFSRFANEITIHIWGGDWCGDCRAILPEFAAALDAAGVPEKAIKQYPVDRQKTGELTDEYDIGYIPTIIIERDGEEVARFVEDAPVSAAESLANQLETLES